MNDHSFKQMFPKTKVLILQFDDKLIDKNLAASENTPKWYYLAGKNEVL